MHVEAPAFGEKDILMKQDCFRAVLPGMPIPAAEIGDLRYFEVPSVIIIMRQLKKDNLID